MNYYRFGIIIGLENKIKNLNQEIIVYKTQLNGKSVSILFVI